MKVQCPNCTTKYQVDSSKIPEKGIHARCGKCQTRFFLKKDIQKKKPEPEIICQNCGHKLRLSGYTRTLNENKDFCKCDQKKGDFKMLYNPEIYDTETIRETVKKTIPQKRSSYTMLDAFWGLFSNDLAIDLGTANTLVYLKKRGIVLNESSVVALRTDMNNGKRILAVGLEAKRMMGRTPENVVAIRPMRDGVIADFEVAGAMLGQFIDKVRRRSFIKPRMIIAVPSGITPVERRAVKDSAHQAGAREVYLIDEPMAAAIGADLPVTEPVCNMVVDIGGGTTEVAVISLSGIVVSKSLKVAGDAMDMAIIQYIKKKYKFIIGERTAEEIKIKIGNACPDPVNLESIEVKGWEIVTGRPRIIAVNSLEVREAIAEQLKAIADAVRLVLDKTPQELAAGAIEDGLILTGGVALLKNLDKFIMKETGIPVTVAEDPLSTIVMGSGKVMDNARLSKEILSV